VRVIGIDASITETGIADVDGRLTTAGGDSPLGDRRLQVIHDAVTKVCVAGRPDLAVLEDLPTHAHGAGITGMAQGVIRLALLDRGVPYVTVVAATLKKYATGNGGANKSDMRMALYKRAGIDERNDNKVDAWWLRHAGLDHFDEALVALPAAQRAALGKVAWPDVAAVR
jgi:Holliday junction resolvasome RuvABC endonuclease subunit